MSLEFKFKENIFTINGSLEMSNLDIFNSHFGHIFNSTNTVVIGIEKFDCIDNYGS